MPSISNQKQLLLKLLCLPIQYRDPILIVMANCNREIPERVVRFISVNRRWDPTLESGITHDPTGCTRELCLQSLRDTKVKIRDTMVVELRSTQFSSISLASFSNPSDHGDHCSTTFHSVTCLWEYSNRTSMSV